MKLNGNLQFLGLGQVQNFRVENLATDPSSPAVGQVWYNTTDSVYKGFDGNEIFTFATGGNATALQAEVDAIEAAVGLNTDGTFAAFTGTTYLGSATTFKGAMVLLDTAIKANADAIAQEVTDREAADAAEVTARDAAIATAVGNEATARDAAIATAVADEATARDAAILVEKTRAEGAEADLQAAVDLKVSKAGDSMTGQLAMSNNKIIGLAAPENAADAVNKNYVDSLLGGLSWLAPVAAVAADHTAATGLAVGDRVADTTDNKIYTVTATAPLTFDAGVALRDGDAFFDKSDETGYVYSGTAVVQFTGSGQITAGVGLSKTGNQIDVNLGAGIAQLPTDEVGVDVLAAGGLFLTVDGTTASTDTASQLSVKLDGTTLSRSNAGLKVSDSTIATITAVATDLAAEVTRAEGAEADLQTAITAEQTRAEGIEAGLRTDLTAEVTRAEGAEADLQTAIDGLSARQNVGYFLYTSGAAATTHTVTHNFGNQYATVTVVDSTDQVIIPQSITFTDANSLSVAFNTAITCKVVVTGLKSA